MVLVSAAKEAVSPIQVDMDSACAALMCLDDGRKPARTCVRLLLLPSRPRQRRYSTGFASMLRRPAIVKRVEELTPYRP